MLASTLDCLPGLQELVAMLYDSIAQVHKLCGAVTCLRGLNVFEFSAGWENRSTAGAPVPAAERSLVLQTAVRHLEGPIDHVEYHRGP